MPPASFEEGETHGRDIVELLQRAQVHQREAEYLLALAEQLSRTAPVGSKFRPCDKKMANVQFTTREGNVAELLTEGMSNRIIARALGISERTVKNHLNSIFRKLGVAGRTQAVIALMRGAEE